ncbi:MAG: PilN domain-containing protein [bacterium]
MKRGDRLALGIALDGVTATVAWRPAEGEAFEFATTPCDGTPHGVIHAFAELARVVPRPESVHVTLMRPLANARTLEFPRMPRAALERVLERDWSRYVIGMWSVPHTAAARMTKRGQWRCAFAPTEVLEAIAHASDAQGWHNVVVQTGDEALAVAARGITGTEFVIACDHAEATDGVQLDDGEPIAGRRFPRPCNDADLLDFVHTTSGAKAGDSYVTLIGPSARTRVISEVFGLERTRIISPGVRAGVSGNAVIAMAGTTGAPMLQLRSPAIRAANARGMRSMTAWLVLGTAAALILAFVIERAAVSSALASVKEQRAEISGQVRKAMADRNDVERSMNTAANLAEREAGASRRTGAIAAIAAALPPGSALTALGFSRDTVTIEGESAHSAAVYEALRTLPQLQQLQLAAQLRQDRQSGDVATEHFAFSAHTRARAPAPRAAP